MNIKKPKPAEAREIARQLFLKEMPQKEIARILQVAEATVSTWVNDGKWKVQRANLLSRKNSRIDDAAEIFDYQLEALKMLTQSYREQFEKGEIKILPLLGKGEADSFSKFFAPLKEAEISWEIIVKVTKDFTSFINARNPDLGKALIPYSDEFIIVKRDPYNV